MKTVVILGAGGRVGHEIAKAFVAAGWLVRGVARGAKAQSLAAGVEPVAADASDGDALVAVCKGADIIVHGLNPLYTEWEEKVMPLARNVLEAARVNGATIMLPGNVYNFGLEIGMNMAEGDPQIGSTAKARIRIEMESMLEAAARLDGVRTIVIRAGDFYGGEKPGTWLDELVLAKLDKGVFTWPGPMDVAHSFAYLPDLALAFVAVAERRADLAPFEVLHFAGHTVTGQEMKAATERAVGRPLLRRGVPWPLLRAAGLFVPMIRELAAMSYLWRAPHSLDGRKLAGLVPDLRENSMEGAMENVVRDMTRQKAA
ncbi:NmrA family NAD(P)-binding protein [Aliihoeflea sp. 40Bstr573]|uniref:NmrA family NAD(P)-binding protein n=1 Tax=Aliihoeflea sp. 40Bstr573 TaxID=2696467 RepID=UPI0020955688|nr:NmrA family NAD(P)-binding protein [Aliihoeflea sp. 40Bstr573]MCO6388209.1 NmrA family NAD(P)-binding protein [Aliihoeflea sp. 40Bstr573]